MSISPALPVPALKSSPVKSYARIPEVVDVPNLIQSQLQSYEWLKTEGDFKAGTGRAGEMVIVLSP